VPDRRTFLRSLVIKAVGQVWLEGIGDDVLDQPHAAGEYRFTQPYQDHTEPIEQVSERDSGPAHRQSRQRACDYERTEVLVFSCYLGECSFDFLKKRNPYPISEQHAKDLLDFVIHALSHAGVTVKSSSISY
jgi:hypothetical protein